MLRLFLVLGLCSGLLSTQAYAAPKKQSAPMMPSEKDRAAAEEFAVRIILPQRQIESSYDLGRVARPPSGGLLDTLIVYSLDDKKEILSKSLNEKAEIAIKPLRMALNGYDVDSLAMAGTAKALAVPSWFRTGPTVLSKDYGPAGQAAEQTALITYRYEMSPDFSSMRVFSDVRLVRNASTIFKQTITSIVQLRRRSFEPSENVQQWSADQGKLAKNALSESFAQMEQLIPFALNLTQADIKAFGAKNREQGFAAGHNGPLIKRGGRSPEDILIWSNGLLWVHTSP